MNNILKAYLLKKPSHIIIVIMLMALIITLFLDENDFEGKQQSGINIDNYFENLYFSAVTMASIGYGDISPTSQRARCLVIFVGVYILCIYLHVI